jgi:hypothetical protein
VKVGDDLIDHGDFDRGKIDTCLVEPEEEAIDRSATALDRGITPSALVRHVRREGCDLVYVGVTCGFWWIMPAQKAQPSLSTVEEPSTRSRS